MSVTKEKRVKAKESYENYHEIFKIVSENQHLSYLEIADILNKCGFKTKRNVSWTDSTVRLFFYNELKIKNNRYSNVIKNKEQIEKIILDNQDKPESEIADILNKLNLKTLRGLNWTKNTVNHYEIRTLKLSPRYGYGKIIDKNQTDNIKQDEDEETIPNYEIKDLVFEKEGKFFTDSLKIASVFDKQHKHILEIIKKLIDTGKIGEPKIRLTSYLTNQNKTHSLYLLDRDIFSLVVMGFNGEKALDFKLAYINKFNEMEEVLKNKQETPPLNNFSAFEVLEQMFRSIKENKTEILQLKENSISAQKTADYALSKILEIEENKKKVENEHQNFEYSGQLAYEIETRKKISRLVKLYIYNKYKTPTSEDYVEAYRMLYVEVYNRLGKDLKTRSENQSKKYNKKVSGLEVAEQLGIIKEVFDIASVVFHHSKVA